MSRKIFARFKALPHRRPLRALNKLSNCCKDAPLRSALWCDEVTRDHGWHAQGARACVRPAPATRATCVRPGGDCGRPVLPASAKRGHNQRGYARAPDVLVLSGTSLSFSGRRDLADFLGPMRAAYVPHGDVETGPENNERDGPGESLGRRSAGQRKLGHQVIRHTARDSARVETLTPDFDREDAQYRRSTWVSRSGPTPRVSSAGEIDDAAVKLGTVP
jgi:hypothetical protein